MKIGTNRNLEDPTGFGTSHGSCSTTQRIYGILFNFCPNKAASFQASCFCIPAIGVCSFAEMAWGLGKGSDDGRQNLETSTKMLMFPPWRSFAAGLMNLSLVRQIVLAFFFGRCTKFPDHHTAGALLHRHVHTTFALAPKVAPSS